jgi:hypothetical protein
VTATPVEISFAGIRLELPARCADGVAVGQTLALTLRRGSLVSSVVGVVKYRRGALCGLHFGEFDRPDRIPPRSFSALVLQLERHWLQHRVA